MFSIKIIDKRVSNKHVTFGISNLEIFLEIFGVQNFPVHHQNAQISARICANRTLEKFSEFAQPYFRWAMIVLRLIQNVICVF